MSDAGESDGLAAGVAPSERFDRPTTTEPVATTQRTTTTEPQAADTSAPAVSGEPIECIEVPESTSLESSLPLPSEPVGRPTAYVLDTCAPCELTGGAAVGMGGPDVECIERRLAQVTVGPINFEIDELFDENTEQAVRWFQESNGLIVDGIVGEQTGVALGIWPS